MIDVSQLGGKISGKVILPWYAEYEEARKVWNGMIDKHPAAIARCSNEDDIAKAIKFARENNMIVAVRGGGHNVAGFGTCDEGLVIDLSSMKNIAVNPQTRIAKAQPGLTWGDFDKATQAHGLATTGGLVSTTGIAGFTLGGGIGWLMRKYGLTIDNLVSADLLTADGSKMRASKAENPDLFWGIKGGGGNFGIVTQFEYALHEVGPEVFGGAVFYPMERSKEILSAFARMIPTFPDELTTTAVFLTAPPAPFIPRNLQGTKMLVIALCYIGSKEEGVRIIEPLRRLRPSIDLLSPIPYVRLQSMFDDGYPRGINAYWKTSYLQELSADAIDALVAQADKFIIPYSQLHIHHLEGAVRRANGNSAFSHCDMPFVLNIVGLWTDPAMAEGNIAWVRKTYDVLRPHSSGAPYLNYLGAEGTDQVRAAYGNSYDRLAELKRKYDPDNLFRINQNVRPSR